MHSVTFASYPQSQRTDARVRLSAGVTVSDPLYTMCSWQKKGDYDCDSDTVILGKHVTAMHGPCLPTANCVKWLRAIKIRPNYVINLPPVNVTTNGIENKQHIGLVAPQISSELKVKLEILQFFTQYIFSHLIFT